MKVGPYIGLYSEIITSYERNPGKSLPGSNPSRIYGLPKLHKTDIPLRPIVSGIGSYTHKLPKYLSDIIKPLATSPYSVKDS